MKQSGAYRRAENARGIKARVMPPRIIGAHAPGVQKPYLRYGFPGEIAARIVTAEIVIVPRGHYPAFAFANAAGPGSRKARDRRFQV